MWRLVGQACQRCTGGKILDTRHLRLQWNLWNAWKLLWPGRCQPENWVSQGCVQTFSDTDNKHVESGRRCSSSWDGRNTNTNTANNRRSGSSLEPSLGKGKPLLGLLALLSSKPCASSQCPSQTTQPQGANARSNVVVCIITLYYLKIKIQAKNNSTNRAQSAPPHKVAFRINTNGKKEKEKINIHTLHRPNSCYRQNLIWKESAVGFLKRYLL